MLGEHPPQWMFYNGVAQRPEPGQARPSCRKNSIQDEIKPSWEAVHPGSGSAPLGPLSPTIPRHYQGHRCSTSPSAPSTTCVRV